MSNKRAVARQLKQKKKQQKQLTIAISIAVVVVIAGIFAVWGYGRYSLSYIMDYDGERIDMPYYLYSVLASDDGSGDNEAVKNNALALLVDFLTLEKHAREDNIVLTEEEKEQSLNAAINMKNIYSQLGYNFSFIDDESMGRLMSRSTLYAHLSDMHTADYVVDEADFQTQLADYKENQKGAYYDIGLKYISAADRETIDEAAAKLTAGNFDAVAEEFSNSYTEESGVAVNELKQVYASLPEEVVNELLTLPVGGRTDVIEINESSFMIFEVTSHSVPTDADVETSYREQYTAMKKDEIFQGILNGWITEAQSVVRLNQRAFDSV